MKIPMVRALHSFAIAVLIARAAEEYYRNDYPDEEEEELDSPWDTDSGMTIPPSRYKKTRLHSSR
jgi:hypothetical protein